MGPLNRGSQEQSEADSLMYSYATRAIMARIPALRRLNWLKAVDAAHAAQRPDFAAGYEQQAERCE